MCESGRLANRWEFSSWFLCFNCGMRRVDILGGVLFLFFFWFAPSTRYSKREGTHSINGGIKAESLGCKLKRLINYVEQNIPELRFNYVRRTKSGCAYPLDWRQRLSTTLTLASARSIANYSNPHKKPPDIWRLWVTYASAGNCDNTNTSKAKRESFFLPLGYWNSQQWCQTSSISMRWNDGVTDFNARFVFGPNCAGAKKPIAYHLWSIGRRETF